MKRLRHPIRAIREPFGTAGLIVAVVALVAAVGGTALAAQKLNATQKKEVEKIAKKVAKPGPPGPAGPKGDPGANGTNGTNGNNGSNGPSGATGPTGGAGKAGATGPTGVTGPTGFSGFTEVLPSGKTETGNWSAIASGIGSSGSFPLGAISYSIPLAAPSAHVVYLKSEATEESTTTPVQGCELEVGNLAAKPVAPPDTLCVFTRIEEEGSVQFLGENILNKGDSPAGTFVWVAGDNVSGSARMWGTWAVTAK